VSPPTGRRSRLRYRWAFVLACLTVTVAVALAFVNGRESPLASTIEAQTIAWRFQMRGPLPPPGEVSVVAIDDRTITALGWPVSRTVLAEAVQRLSKAGAKVIALDLLLLEPEHARAGNPGATGDGALRDALAAAGNAVLAGAFTFEAPRATPAVGESDLREHAFRSVLRPQGSLAPPRASGMLLPVVPVRGAAALAHVNLPLPEDGLVRNVYAAIGLGDSLLPALPVEVARRALDVPQSEAGLVLGQSLKLGGRDIPLDPVNQITINYYGAERTVPTVSLIDLMEDRLPEGTLAGRAVFVGASAVGVGDIFTTPFSGAFPGVEIHATAAANLISGVAIDASARTLAWTLLAILVLGPVCFALGLLPSPLAATACVVAALAGWLAVAQMAFVDRLLLNISFPTAAGVLASGAAGVARNMRERTLRRRAERERSNLAGYHSPEIVDMLAAGNVAALDNRLQDAAILFIDIAGSTGRAERESPSATGAFLSAFHARLERVVLRHHGVLEQITGDGAMILFGVPRPSDDDAAEALACAIDLVAEMKDWSGELAAAGAEPLRIGAGVHFGPVVIARLGGETRHITAAGDTVNVASRIEALTRRHGATVAISAAVVAAVRAGGRHELLAGFAELEPQAIRGRAEPITVWVRRAAAAADLDGPKSQP
jgi:adenylate cyclase